MKLIQLQIVIVFTCHTHRCATDCLKTGDPQECVGGTKFCNENNATENKCPNRSKEAELPTLSGNYYKPIDRPTIERTDRVIGKLHFQ